MIEIQHRGAPSSVVVVGAGLAGWRTATELRRFGFSGRIAVIGEEATAPYDRPPLSKALLGAEAPEGVPLLAPADAAAKLGIELVLGCRARAVQPNAVELEDGDVLIADAIVVATGSRARRPAMLDGVEKAHTLRTYDDAVALRSDLEAASRLVVLGGGFVGAEVASAAADRGIAVQVVELQLELFAGVLGPEVGSVLRRRHEELGVEVALGRSVVALGNSGPCVDALLDDGSAVRADAALLGFGVELNVEPAIGLLSDVSDGLVCDREGRVDDLDRVWAVGDVARWWDPVLEAHVRREHWSSASAQATATARSIVGLSPELDPDVPYFWSDQAGTKLQVVGWPELSNHGAWLDEIAGHRVVHGYFRNDELVAAAVIGAPRALAKMRQQVAGTVTLTALSRGRG